MGCEIEIRTHVADATLTTDVIPGRRNCEEVSDTLSCFALLCIQAVSAESTAGRYTQPTGKRSDSACKGPRTFWYTLY
jgi:hypothetical protein